VKIRIAVSTFSNLEGCLIPMAQTWFVICPETEAPGLWNVWRHENCVAIGWGPPSFTLDGDTEDSGWDIARAKAQRIAIGDIVIPYLLKYRLGVPGEVTRISISDAEWSPTVAKGGYASSRDQAELGRRIEVKWLTDGGPPIGRVAYLMATGHQEVKRSKLLTVR
jgi:hypothetical protein